VSIDSTNEDAFEALQQFADVWHDKYAKPASAGENRKPPSLTMRANGVAAVLTEPQMGAVLPADSPGRPARRVSLAQVD
jgi:hypothetical protein